jgi:hypothetical protein
MTGVFTLVLLNTGFKSVYILILVQMYFSHSTFIDQLAFHQKVPILLAHIFPDPVFDQIIDI